MNRSIEIKSHLSDYFVHFENDLERLFSSLSAMDNNILIVDKRVAGLYPTLINSDRFTCLLKVEAIEENKTLGECEKILKFISDRGANKCTQLIGIGGGIVQDLVTFCAHVYFRGLEWTYVPTTLLGMADSCIGAKASIQLPRVFRKNSIRGFSQPSKCLDMHRILGNTS